MKFLSKNKASDVLKLNLTYKESDAEGNLELLEYLKEEQRNFCAYTESYFKNLDNVHVEHFNSALKYNDDYYNYYAVLAAANNYKKDEEYVNADFFKSLFFQDNNTLDKRISYKDGVYLENDENDMEASSFIDFIGLNHPKVESDRAKHIARLQDTFNQAKYDSDAILNYFDKYPYELCFITAIEYHLKIDLSQFYS
jgi:hypothetical protein